MPKDDKVDENPVDETSQTAAEDVLEQASDVQGDLVDNPKLEEEVEDEADDSEDSAEDSTAPDGEQSTTSEDAAESEEDDSADEASEDNLQTTKESETAKSATELATEKDETGVYETTPPVDPGEFQPKKDYSFEVTTTDGKTHKITSQEEIDAFASLVDEDPASISASQFAKFTQGMTKMAVGIDTERANWEADKEKFDTQQAQTEAKENQLKQWNSEINYLRAKGLLPEITPEQNASNWLDPKNAEVPAIKETLDVFNWMQKENEARREAGIPEVTSAVDAFTMMQAEQKDNAANEERTSERATRQAKGSMVGKTAPHAEYTPPKNSIVGEGGSLSDLVTEASVNL